MASEHRCVTDGLYVVPCPGDKCEADVLARAFRLACEYIEKEYSGRSEDFIRHFLLKARHEL